MSAPVVVLPRRRAGAVLMACALGFLTGEVVATLLVAIGTSLDHYPGGLTALAHAATPPWWANALSLAGLWVGFGGAILYSSGPGGLAPLPAAWRVRASDAGYVALGVGCQVAVGLIYAPFHVKSLGRPVHHLFASASGASLVALGVMTSLLAPLLEEWFFRGVVFRALESAAGASSVGTVAAVVLSALLFAAAHAELVQFAGLALLGVVLAVLVVRTQRLVPSVITHASFNSVAFVALLVQRAH
ncbi:MAG: lysostaphin resistance A-like protein [Acidimicrobiales bacterium]